MSKKAAKKSKAKDQKSKSVKKAGAKKAAAKKTTKKPVAKKAVANLPAKAKARKRQAGKPVANLPAKAKAKQPQAGKPTKTAKQAKTEKKVNPPLLNAIIDGLEERKAKNITVLDLHGIHGRSFDYFVIADADSGTHVESIASSVEEEVKKKLSERPFHTEGWQNAEWILLDYINIIVHVFQRPVREFYNLEGLWADAEVQKIN